MAQDNQRTRLKRARKGLCPFCESMATSYENLDLQDAVVSQRAECGNCEAQWIEFYEMYYVVKKQD